MGGKTGTTTSQVTIPPEVLQRYTAVNKLAEQTAQTPFQPYTGQFVAPLTATQQAGIAQTQAASQAAQPYFGAATQNLLGAQAAAAPALTGAGQTLAEAQQAGRGYADVAGQLYGQAGLAASPYYQAATRGTQAALRGAQPYQQAATQFGLAGSQAIDPSALNIGAYMSPYTQAVAATTQQALQQQQQQEMAGQLGNAIRSGAFGGDRAGIVAANLARQQQLGMAQAMAPIYQQGYAQALQAAQQQQGLGLSAAQANRAALQQAAQQMASLGQQGYGQQLGAAQQMAGLGQALYGQALGTGQAISGLGQQQFGQGATTAQQQAALAQQLYGMGAGTAQQLAALGTGAQQAGLQGAQATIGAGTLEQQTQQAQDTAKYQQFLQERGYPFQVAQFLANIAMGTGALSGSTTTTQQPIPFFSDRRLKDDVKQIGKTNDGMPIYSFKYKGDDATQIGLMAQDVEKKHPEAVGLAGGYKTVDYAKATEDSARPERMEGGLVPSSMGGSVYDPGAFARGGYAIGGDVIDPNDLQAILQQQQQSFGPFGEGGVYGGSQHKTPYQTASGIVPQTRLHTPRLATSSAPTTQTPQSTASQAMEAIDQGLRAKQQFQDIKDIFSKKPTAQQLADQSRPAPSKADIAKMAGPDIVPEKSKDDGILAGVSKLMGFMSHGGVVPENHYEFGGTAIDPYSQRPSESGVPADVLEKGEEKIKGLKSPSAPSPITRGPGNDILDIAKIAMMFMRDGGVVPRNGYREGGDPKYKIQPLDVENMPEHRQELIRGIYGPESGGRYDIMQGGQETFDTSGPHPGRVGRGGESTAAGAGQFIKGTWDDVTGGAPMTKAYQDAATWALASRDYKARTGKDLDATLQEEGFSPAVRSALARTWTALGSPADRAAPGAKVASGQMPEEKPSEEKGFTSDLQKWVQQNYGWLGPVGAGLKGMVQSKSPFLGAAVLEGVGAGLEALPTAAKTQQEIAASKAAAISALSGIDPDKLIGEIDPITGKVTYRIRPDYFGGSLAKKGQPTDALATEQQKAIETGKAAVEAKSPIMAGVAQGQYNFDLAPTARVDQAFANRGFTGDPSDAWRIPANLTPEERRTADADRELQNNRKLEAQNIPQMRQETNMLADAVLGISPSGITGAGPGQSGRARLVNMYNWVVRNGGLPGSSQIGENADITNAEIVRKITSAAGTRVAGERGFHAGYIAQAINEAQASGELTPEASAKILASTYTNMQMAEDFSKYAANYVRKYGTTLDLDKNFKLDMGQHYEDAKKAMADALLPRLMPDGTYQSGFTWLRKNPDKADEFDKTYKVPGLARMVLGG